MHVYSLFHVLLVSCLQRLTAPTAYLTVETVAISPVAAGYLRLHLRFHQRTLRPSAGPAAIAA